MITNFLIVFLNIFLFTFGYVIYYFLTRLASLILFIIFFINFLLFQKLLLIDKKNTKLIAFYDIFRMFHFFKNIYDLQFLS